MSVITMMNRSSGIKDPVIPILMRLERADALQ